MKIDKIGLIMDKPKSKDDFFGNINTFEVINDDILSSINTLYVFCCDDLIEYSGPKYTFIESLLNKFSNIKTIYFYINGDELGTNTIVSHGELLETFDIKIGYYINPLNRKCWINFINQLYCDIELSVSDVFCRVKEFAKYSIVYVNSNIKEFIDNPLEIELFLTSLGFNIIHNKNIEEIQCYKLHCLL